MVSVVAMTRSSAWSSTFFICIMIFFHHVHHSHGCVKCECDLKGALSSCQKDHCAENHELVQNPSGVCRSKGLVCCHVLCHGKESQCMPDTAPCGDGDIEIKNTKCKKGFKCCQKKSQAVLTRFRVKST